MTSGSAACGSFYLAGSEASFRLGQNVVYQLQLSRNIEAVPMTRDYIAQREEELRQREPDPLAYRMAGE